MNNEAAEPTKKKKKRHWFIRGLRGLGLLVLALVIVYLVADQIALRKFHQQQDIFRERFGKADFEEFIPEHPPAEEDAGRVYRYAAGLMAEVDEELGDWSMYGALTQGPESFAKRGSGDEALPAQAEVDAMVQEKMAAMTEAYQVLAEARALDRGSMLESFSMGVGQLPELTEARQLARNIAAKALYEARAGNLEGACAWLESGLHLASTFNEDPTLVVQMVRTAIVLQSVKSAELVFNTTEGLLPLSDRYWELLDRVTALDVFVNTLASEASFTNSTNMDALPRLVWSLNGRSLLACYLNIIDAAQLPRSAERWRQIEAIAGEVDGGRTTPNVFAKMLAPVLVRNIESYDDMNARCDFVRMAVALRGHKVAHGAYPPSLETIASSTPSPLPLDPFSGEAYHYRTEGEGFVLYSVGPNRTDDGGAADDRKTGDILWTTTQ